VDAETLKVFCQRKIASYKLPKVAEFLLAIPKSATGRFSTRTPGVPAEIVPDRRGAAAGENGSGLRHPSRRESLVIPLYTCYNQAVRRRITASRLAGLAGARDRRAAASAVEET